MAGWFGAGVRRAAIWLTALCLLSPIAGCGSFNAATGRWQPVYVSVEQEELIGAESHERFLGRFDLATQPPIEVLQAEVERIGRRLAAVSEMPDLDWRFYILDDDNVNAFAAPGGRLYLTRGLLAYADEEEDIAGVIAHEIGHITAAHYKDMLEAQPTALAKAKLRVAAEIADEAEVPDAETVSRRVEKAAFDAIADISQRNELEADVLSTRYLARAGYPPQAALDFMKDVIALQAFLAKEAETRGVAVGEAVFQSHPLSEARVLVTEAALEQAAVLAAEAGPVAEGAIRQHRKDWLAMLDGIAVEQGLSGIVRGGRFGWPEQGFRIDAPRGMTLIATRDGVIGKGEAGDTLYVDSDYADLFADPETALDDLRLRLSAAAGRSAAVFSEDARPVRVGRWPGLGVEIPPSEHESSNWLTLIVVEGPEGMIRVIYGGETRNRRAHRRSLRRILRSLRPLSAKEAQRFAPLRLEVAPLGEGETLESIARRAPIYGLGAQIAGAGSDQETELALALQRLRLINGLAEGERPTTGALVKRYSR